MVSWTEMDNGRTGWEGSKAELSRMTGLDNSKMELSQWMRLNVEQTGSRRNEALAELGLKTD